MAVLFDSGIFSVIGINSELLIGAKLYWYAEGTSTPLATYSDNDLTVPNTNPVVANGDGRWPSIYLQPEQYKYILTRAGGDPTSPLVTREPISGLDPITVVEALYDTIITTADSGATFKAKWESAQTGIVIEAGDYTVPSLSTSVDGLVVRALGGQVNIFKGANGPIWAHSGSYGAVHGITFRGASGHTGDNLDFTGQGNEFWNCGSLDAAGRALKSAGYVNIYGSNPAWSTADATSAGYDIEIGTSGVATLYSQLNGIYSSLPTGGILLIDNGSQSIKGGQFGKLTIQSGTGPAGVNGGMIRGARILGAVTVGLSSAVFSGNQFGAVAITFNAGTGGCSMDASNVYETGCTITNSGNLNNLIMRNTLVGGVLQIAYGDTTNKRLMTISPNDITSGWGLDGALTLPNAQSYRATNNAGTASLNVAVYSGANNNLTLGDNTTAGATTVQAGPGGVYTAVSGASITHTDTASFNPQTDNTVSLGLSGQRWTTVYAATATINTSDGNDKTDIRDITDNEKLVATELKGLMRAFRMKDAVADKGDTARIHFGIIAQDVETAFTNHGLDAHDYGLFCFDEWNAQPAHDAVTDSDGAVIEPARAAIAAGSRFGIRYDELHAFILAAL